MGIGLTPYQDGYRKTAQVKFLGYDASPGAGEGSICDMKNMTSDYYPMLASRTQRKILRTLTTPNGIASAGKLCWADGRKLYYDGTQVGSATLLTNGKKIIVGIGDYIVVWPDKLYYDTVAGTIGYVNFTVGPTILDIMSKETEWSTENNAVCMVGNVTGFQVGDAVDISGCTAEPGNNTSAVIRAIIHDTDATLGSEITYLIFTDNTFAEESEEPAASVSRTAPDLDFMFEHNNRLWGCKDDTIYVSALGDIKNWNIFDGTASDSYAVSTGSPGKFTGAISYGGYPRFFKNDCIYTVYGTYPQEYQYQKYAALGVAQGSGNSLAIAGGVLFYLSRMGICAYTGGMPSLAATAFGLKIYKNAVAGADGVKYYISMEDEDENSHLFVYDAVKGIWMREDGLDAVGFAYDGEKLIVLDSDGVMKTLGRMSGTSGTDEGKIEWMAEFADITEEYPDDKNVNGLKLRMEMDSGAAATVQMKFNGESSWTTLGTKTVGEKQSFEMPIIPRRADCFRIRIFGIGQVRICSLARNTEKI